MYIARATIFIRAFCNSRSDFHMEKTVYYEYARMVSMDVPKVSLLLTLLHVSLIQSKNNCSKSVIENFRSMSIETTLVST